MQFAELQRGDVLNGKRTRGKTQPCATAEYNRHTGATSVKITAALFRTDTLTRGVVDAPYPANDPPSGAARWVYTLSARAWVDPRASARATRRELQTAHGAGLQTWGLGGD
eukprot:3557002-Prymnesium_polylepis.2